MAVEAHLQVGGEEHWYLAEEAAPWFLGAEAEEKRFDVEEVEDQQRCQSRWSWKSCLRSEALPKVYEL